MSILAPTWGQDLPLFPIHYREGPAVPADMWQGSLLLHGGHMCASVTLLTTSTTPKITNTIMV